MFISSTATFSMQAFTFMSPQSISCTPVETTSCLRTTGGALCGWVGLWALGWAQGRQRSGLGLLPWLRFRLCQWSDGERIQPRCLQGSSWRSMWLFVRPCNWRLQKLCDANKWVSCQHTCRHWLHLSAGRTWLPWSSHHYEEALTGLICFWLQRKWKWPW